MDGWISYLDKNIFRLENWNSSDADWLAWVTWLLFLASKLPRSPAISNDRNLDERSTVINAKLEVTQLIYKFPPLVFMQLAFSECSWFRNWNMVGSYTGLFLTLLVPMCSIIIIKYIYIFVQHIYNILQSIHSLHVSALLDHHQALHMNIVFNIF